jgi:hypothetical protein
MLLSNFILKSSKLQQACYVTVWITLSYNFNPHIMYEEDMPAHIIFT